MAIENRKRTVSILTKLQSVVFAWAVCALVVVGTHAVSFGATGALSSSDRMGMGQASAGTGQGAGAWSQSKAISPQYLNLRLTYGLTSAIFAGAFKEANGEFNARYFSHKQYLLLFLSRWSELIESGRFQSTAQIFAQIKSDGGYLAQYYSLWEGMTSGSSSTKISLGGYRSAALAVVFRSEGNPAGLTPASVQRRFAELLDRIHYFILASSKDYETSQVIGESFMGVEDALVRERAHLLVNSVPAQEFLSFLVTARDLFLPLSPLKPIVQTVQVSLKAASKARALVHQAALRLNPILRRMTDLQKGAIGAGLVHLGAYKAMTDLEVGMLSDAGVSGNKVSDQRADYSPRLLQGAQASQSQDGSATQPSPQEIAESLQSRSMAVALAVLWQNVAFLDSDLIKLTSTDFVPSFKPATKEEIIRETRSLIQASLQGAGNPRAEADYLTLFLQAEKLGGIDERGPKDQFAMHTVKARLDEIESRLSTQLRTLSPTAHIDAFRRALIDGGLNRYKRDYPNLTSVYLGWGGNCVAQTMAMTGMFKRLEGKLQFPEGLKFGIALFPQHIEAVLYNNEKVILLMSGQTVERKDGLIYKPEYLLYVLLKNFNAEGQLTVKNFIDGNAEERMKQWNVKETVLGALSTALSNLTMLKGLFIRKGVLEEMGDSLFTWTGKLRWPSFIPEVAEMGFRPTDREKGGSTEFPNLFLSFFSSSSSILDMFQSRDLEIVLDLAKTPDQRRMGSVYRGYHRLRPFVVEWKRKAKGYDIFVWDQARFDIVNSAMKRYGANSAMFKKFLIQYMMSEAEKTKEFETAYAVASSLNQIEDLLKVKDEDVKLTTEVLNEIYWIQTVELPMRIGKATKCIGPQPDRCINYEDGQGPVMDERDLDRYYSDTPGYRLNAKLNKFRDLLLDAAGNPERFLRLYNQATLAQRQHFLVDVFDAQQVLNPIKTYLESISQVEVEIPARYECSKHDVDVPTISAGDAPSWAHIIKDKCVRPPVESQSTEPSRAGKKQKLTFKPNILIELTARTRKGLHLWTPKLVDLYIAKTYGKLAYDEAFPDAVLKDLLRDDDVATLPRHLQKLREHLFAQSQGPSR